VAHALLIENCECACCRRSAGRDHRRSRRHIAASGAWTAGSLRRPAPNASGVTGGDEGTGRPSEGPIWGLNRVTRVVPLQIGPLVAPWSPRLIQINGLPLNRRQKWRVAFGPRRVFIVEVIGFTTCRSQRGCTSRSVFHFVNAAGGSDPITRVFLTRFGMTWRLFYAITLMGTGALLISPAKAVTAARCEDQFANSCVGGCADFTGGAGDYQGHQNKCMRNCDRRVTRCLIRAHAAEQRWYRDYQ